LYTSPNIVRVIKSRRLRRANHAACMVEKKNGKLEGRRPFGRPGHKWEDNIKI